MTCDSCGGENREGRKFCARCGSLLTIVCSACQATNEPGERFCGECGTPLEAGAASIPAAGPPARAASAPAPVAERRVVSVLFADLVGFTSLSESRDAEAVRELLSRYFESCRRLVELYGGTVEKFIGDAVMAVWGTPIAQEDDAERAVRTALDLVAAVSALGDELETSGLRARAGVATGEAAVTLGAQGQGMVAGDLVNTAARIQSAADPGDVLVSDATRRATEAAIAYGDPQPHEVKGKRESITLFPALRVTSGRGGALRAVGLEPPFVGRTRQLRLVKELFHASAEERRAHLLSIIGIAGIGKSRLGWEFFKYIDGLADDVYWHRGRCLAYGEGVAYWALAEMVRGRAGIREGEDAAAGRERLARCVAEHLPDADERAWVEPRLANLLGLEERVDADRQDLFGAWRVFFERLGERYPVVMVFEDMQWADGALLAFVEYLLESSATQPLFVLALGRPELLERAPDFGRGVRNASMLALEPLPQEAMTALLDGFAPGLPDELTARILERADGVPLYAVETVRMLLDRGFLVREGAVYRPSATIEKLDVPETLHALVAARLDALHADERRLVQDASVLGKSFSPDALADLLPFDTRQLEELLAGLVRKEVLGFQSDPRSPERGQYAFLQDLLRKVAYDTLARRDRKARHLAAADALVARSGGDGEVPEVLASHYVAAYECAPNDPDAGAVRRKAGNALVLAAERAAALAAPGEGQRHFEQAAALADDTSERATLLERAGRLALNANATDQARRLLVQAITLHGEAGDARRAARASAALADVDFAEDRLDDSATRLERAIEMLDGSEPTRELAAALAQLGRAYALRGDIARAADTLDRALRMAEVLADEPAFIDALISRSVVLTRQSRMREARILLEAAVAAARDAELPGTWWRAANNLGVVHEDGDRPLEGLELAREMLAQARKRGDRHAEAFAVVGQLSALVALGRWSEALSILAGAEPLVGSSGILRAQLVDVVPVYCEQGRLEDAEALLAGMADVSATDSAEVKASLETAEAAVRRARGDHAGALEVARRAIARSSELGITNRLVKESFVHAAEASLRLDDLEQTRTLLAIVEHLPPGELTPYLEAHAARVGANIAARVGDDAEASRRFQAAARAFRASGFAFWHAATLVEHAEWLAATRRPAEAADLAEQARDFLTEACARPWLDRIDALTGQTAARA